jgi:hypothetical protein
MPMKGNQTPTGPPEVNALLGHQLCLCGLITVLIEVLEHAGGAPGEKVRIRFHSNSNQLILHLRHLCWRYPLAVAQGCCLLHVRGDNPGSISGEFARTEGRGEEWLEWRLRLPGDGVDDGLCLSRHGQPTTCIGGANLKGTPQKISRTTGSGIVIAASPYPRRCFARTLNFEAID